MMQRRCSLLLSLSKNTSTFATTSLLYTPRVVACPYKSPFPYGKITKHNHHEEQQHNSNNNENSHFQSKSSNTDVNHGTHNSPYDVEASWQSPLKYVEGEYEKNCVHTKFILLRDWNFWFAITVFVISMIMSQNGIFYQKEHHQYEYHLKEEQKEQHSQQEQEKEEEEEEEEKKLQQRQQ